MFRMILNRTARGITDFILPKVCLCCDSPIEYTANGNKFICSKCYGKLERYNEQHPWKNEYISRGIVDNSMSAFWFRDGAEIQTLMHEMKYGKMKSVGKLFGRELGRIIADEDTNSWDFIIPVPLHKARQRDRMYNQSEFIAGGINEKIKAVVLADGIIRTRFTGTQTKLNKQERKENVKDAFMLNPKYKQDIVDKNTIVVDDVITTGATILECAEMLKQTGAGKVWVCSAAYAELSAKS